VGLFTLLLGGAFILIVLWLAGHEYRQAFQPYYAYFRESVSGLSVDAPVTYRGVNVGKVTEIRLAPDNPEVVRLTLQIEEGTPIKQDTRAQLSFQGVTGVAFVDLTGGSREAPPLKPKYEDQIPVIETVPSLFERLDTTLSEVAEQFSTLAQDARALLSEDNRVAFKNTLTNLDAVTSTLATHRESLGSALDRMAKTLETGQQVSAQLGDTITHFTSVAQAVEKMVQEFTGTAQQLNALLKENSQGVAGLTRQTLPSLNQLLAELRQMTSNLNRLAQLLERQPNALLFGRQSPPPGPGER
jgi:phospholipid/cholesterol/gamma-HCH transport system substrate-binding protein